MILTYRQQQLVKILQEELPLSTEPFACLAQHFSISEEEILQELQFLQEKGYLRRIAAILNHHFAGFSYNALSVWKVEESRIDRVGEILAASPHTTHVIQRQCYTHWPYNLYAMLHGKSKNDCFKIAEDLSQTSGEKDYQLLFTQKEFKKTSMRYF